VLVPLPSYLLSLHDALPIFRLGGPGLEPRGSRFRKNSFPVQRVLQPLSSGEPGRGGSGDVDYLPGLRVAPLSGRTPGCAEAPEAGDPDVLPLSQRRHDRSVLRVEERVDDSTHLASRHSGALRNILDELALVHALFPSLWGSE